jgi:hypothetical protein
LNANYRQIFSDEISADFGGSVLDVIEYRRHQGLRERLEASPYREGNAHARYKFTSDSTLEFATIHGHRSADGLWRHEYTTGLWNHSFFGPRINAHLEVGYRSNFVSNDIFGHMGIGYYSRVWEITWDETGAYESYKHEKNLYPVVSDIELSYYFSKTFYASLSFEHAIDNHATLYSGFLKMGYRFGNREVPNVRDTAPVRGAL